MAHRLDRLVTILEYKGAPEACQHLVEQMLSDIGRLVDFKPATLITLNDYEQWKIKLVAAVFTVKTPVGPVEPVPPVTVPGGPTQLPSPSPSPDRPTQLPSPPQATPRAAAADKK